MSYNNSEFERRVREVVFQDNIFHSYLEKHIAKAEIERSVLYEVQEKLPKIIDRHVENSVPKYVNQEIARFLPTWLDNHGKIQTIFNNHLPKVEQRIEDTTRTVVNRIVKEDQYRTVNKAFLNEFKEECGSDINKLKQDVSTLESKNNWLFAGWLATAVAGGFMLIR